MRAEFMTEFAVAYCGAPPMPEDLWRSWNFDPLVLAALGLFTAFAIHRRSKSAGLSAFLMMVIFVSPFCALTSALFSARVLHHVLLVSLVAPLLARAIPAANLPVAPIALATLAKTVVLWLWHVPEIYVWGISSAATYWLMQTTLLLVSWVFWRSVFDPRSTSAAVLAGLLGTIAQMGLLGAILVFATKPLYLVHLTTTAAWGLSPLEDQQLAGLVMWAPSILPYLAFAILIVWRLATPAPASR